MQRRHGLVRANNKWVPQSRHETLGDPTFDMQLDQSGIDKLDRNLVINNQEVEPDFWINGRDASLTTWVGETGETYTYGGSGSDIILNEPTPFKDDSKAIRFVDGSKRIWTADSTDTGDITNKDFVLETVIDSTALTVNQNDYIRKNNYQIGGWNLYKTSLGVNIVFIIGNDSSNYVYSAVNIGAGKKYLHTIAYWDFSARQIGFYVNTIAGTAVTLGTVNTLTSSGNIVIGCEGSTNNTGGLVYAAGWKKENWLDTHLQPTHAIRRFAKLAGAYPQIGNGTRTPQTLTCATDSTLEKYDPDTGKTYFFTMGPNWPRIVRQKDFINSDALYSGTNLITRPNDLSTAAWTKAGATPPTVTGNTTDIEDPHGMHRATKIANLQSYALGTGYIYSIVALTTGNKAGIGFRIYPISSSGSIYIINPSSNTYGRWQLDFSTLPLGQWTEINRSTIGTYGSVVNEFTGYNNLAGLLFATVSGSLDMYLWGCTLEDNGAGGAYTLSGTYDLTGPLVKTGLHQEKTATNSVQDSDDPDGGDWTKTNCTRSATTVECPIVGVTAYGLDTASASGNVEHKITTTKTPATPQEHNFNFMIAPGVKTWVRLKSVDNGSNTIWANFHLAGDGSFGARSATSNFHNWGIRPLGIFDGRRWYEIHIGYYGPGASHAHDLILLDSDSTAATPTYTGTDSTDVWWISAGHNYEIERPHSRIKTVAASGTRNYLSLEYKGDDGNVANNRTGRLICQGWLKASARHSPTAQVAAFLTDVSGGTADRQGLYWTNAYETLGMGVVFASTETGANFYNMNTGYVLNGKFHIYEMKWDYAKVTLALLLDGYKDYNLVTTETAPNDIDRISIGCGYALGEPTVYSIINRVQIFDGA